MAGFLVQWPTIPTLAMFPVLVAVYLRLARSEEREVAGRLSPEWAAYAARTPGFIPAAIRRPFRRPARGSGAGRTVTGPSRARQEA